MPFFLIVLNFSLFSISRLTVPAPSPPVLILLVFHLFLAANIDLIVLIITMRVRSLQVIVVCSRVVVFLLLLLLFFLSLIVWRVVGIKLGFSRLRRWCVELYVYQALHTA